MFLAYNILFKQLSKFNLFSIIHKSWHGGSSSRGSQQGLYRTWQKIKSTWLLYAPHLLTSIPPNCLLSDCQAEWETRWCINMQTALSWASEGEEDDEGKGRRIWSCQLKCSGPWWPCGKPVHLSISTVMSLHWLIVCACALFCVYLPLSCGILPGDLRHTIFFRAPKFYF